jgi:hypothetical protein
VKTETTKLEMKKTKRKRRRRRFPSRRKNPPTHENYLLRCIQDIWIWGQYFYPPC